MVHKTLARDGAASQREDTRLRILEAAAELMGERGSDGVSVQAIADLAAVNKALVYYYFGNKKRLFEHIFEHFLEGLHGALSESLAGGEGSPTDKLHAVIDAYCDYIEQHPSYPRLVQRELANAQGRHDLLATYNARNFDLVRDAMGELAGADDGPAAAHQLFASVVGMVLYYYLAAPIMAPLVVEPLEQPARRARRAHVHWMLDASIARLVPG